eukprot:jgi/Botrbrau1/13273/Bobra.0074s0021.1
MQISRIGTMPQHSFSLWFPVLAFLHIPLGDSPRSKKWAIPTLNKGQMYMVPLLTYLSWGIVVHPISTMEKQRIRSIESHNGSLRLTRKKQRI